MPPFSNSNATRFRMPPLEEPHVASRSYYRVFAELGFVASIIAGVCIQRYGIVLQTNTAADISKAAVFVVGAWTCGENIGCLCSDWMFGPKYIPPPQPRRRRRRRGVPA